jgi:hypothetical protein
MVTHCTACGAPRDPGTRFCRSCGRQFDETGSTGTEPLVHAASGTAAPRPQPDGHPPATGVRASTTRSAGHGGGWYAAVAAGAVAAVVALVLGVLALTGRGPEGGGDAAGGGGGRRPQDPPRPKTQHNLPTPNPPNISLLKI